MKDKLQKVIRAVSGLIVAYIVLLATFNGCITSYYTPEGFSLYVYEDNSSDFQHGVYLSGNKIAVYRGSKDGSYGENAIHVANFKKWDWYFPGVYVKPDSSFIFGLRFVDLDCIPTTMEWKTIYNQSVGNCKPYYTDREWFSASVQFYDNSVSIANLKYQKIKVEGAPLHLKRLKDLFAADLKN